MSVGQIILNIFLSGLIQVVLWVGGTLLLSVLLTFGNFLFYKCTGKASRAINIITAAIGTPLHELGHALFCLIFAHKITDIKLFQPSAPNGTLGYVSHSYNPKNPYQRVGNFFIAIGPILFISAIVILLQFLLVPDLFSLNAAINDTLNGSLSIKGITFGGILYLESFFSLESVCNPLWWVYVVISSFICLHMNLSKADKKNSLSGLLLVIILVFLVPVIASFFDLKGLTAMTMVNGAMITGAIFYLGFMITAVAFVYMLIVVAFLVRLFIKFFKPIMKKIIKKSVMG